MRTPFVLLTCALLLTACSQQTAEEKGVALATEKIDTVKGVGAALEAKGSAAAESLAAGLGQVKNGVERGIERSGRSLELQPTMAAAQLHVSRVQAATPPAAGASSPAPHGLEAYLVAKAPAQGTLRVYALDVMGQELGRTKVPLDLASNDAKYQLLPFEPNVKLDEIKSLRFDFEAKAAAR
jgi:hypothetical protein